MLGISLTLLALYESVKCNWRNRWVIYDKSPGLSRTDHEVIGSKFDHPRPSKKFASEGESHKHQGDDPGGIPVRILHPLRKEGGHRRRGVWGPKVLRWGETKTESLRIEPDRSTRRIHRQFPRGPSKRTYRDTDFVNTYPYEFLRPLSLTILMLFSRGRESERMGDLGITSYLCLTFGVYVRCLRSVFTLDVPIKM